MATLLEIDRVQYLCTCQTWFPLSRLYFCRHCSLLRCRECVTHEIDSIFCPNCLENMPTAEARVKKNRCGNCFDCPCCNNTLAIRGTSLLPQGAIRVDEPSAEATGGGLAPKKAYYLACNFCRWTSRDSGIGDQTTATAGWPERVNSDEKILAAIQDQFRQMAAVEKSERERKKFTKRRSHFGMFYSDKYGLQALMARRRLGFGATDKNQVAEEPCMEPSEDLPLLPDQIFASELTLDEVTTIEQRHKQVLGQPEDTKELLPIRKRLVVRRSLRCKQCDHNLCKGEYNPSSIKFKIQLFAILHVPEVRILHIPKLIAGKLCEIHLTLANLSQSLTHVVLLPDVEMEEDFTFAKVDIPVTEMVLPVRDEAAELDDSGDQGNIFKDDPRIAPRAAAHVRARSVSSHLTLLDDGLYKHLKGNNMELVRLVKFLQSSMQDEQQRFSELRQRIATAEQSGENADQLKEELCLSQSRLAQLCSKNMKCFKKQGSSFSGNNDGGALEGSGKAGKQTTRKSLSTLHREKKRKENTNETEDNSGSTEVKQVEPNEDPLRSAFQAVLRDILGQNYQLGPSDQLENREIMYSSSTNFPRQEESRSKLFDELRTSVPRIPPTAVSEDSNLSRSPDRESPTPAIMGQSISHMTILDKSQDLLWMTAIKRQIHNYPVTSTDQESLRESQQKIMDQVRRSRKDDPVSPQSQQREQRSPDSVSPVKDKPLKSILKKHSETNSTETDKLTEAEAANKNPSAFEETTSLVTDSITSLSMSSSKVTLPTSESNIASASEELMSTSEPRASSPVRSECKQSRFVNMEGHLDHLPLGMKSPVLDSSWKSHYFKTKEGKLLWFQRPFSDDYPLGDVLLAGSDVDIRREECILSVHGGRDGSYLVLRSTPHLLDKWRQALLSHAASSVADCYVQPLYPPVPHPSERVAIIELGSCSIRAGLLSVEPSLPQVFFPTVASVLPNGEIVVGVEALRPEMRHCGRLVWPITATQPAVNRYTMDLDIVKHIIQKVFDDLEIHPASYKVLLSVPQNCPVPLIVSLLKLFVEEFGVKGVGVVRQPSLVLYAYDVTTGVVLDIGDRMNIVPVIDGYVVQNAIVSLPYGSCQILESLREKLCEQNIGVYAFVSAVEKFILRYIMEEACRVAPEYDKEVAQYTQNPNDVDKIVTLAKFEPTPQMQKAFNVGSGQFTSTEGLLKPKMWGLDINGLHKLIFSSIQTSPMDTRRTLYRNIYLAGGCSLLPGLAERLENELSQLVAPSIHVQVHISPWRYHAAFIGAQIVAASLQFDQSLVTERNLQSFIQKLYASNF